ncbi:MAG: hypothetical protein LBG93_07610 [Treponema sp.]|jgi:hypothetical protein|nr:hypothetical protein [Treponema sp.]
MILSVDSAAGIIRIGSPPEELPGIVESIKIKNSLLTEYASVLGRSGNVKIVSGWNDVDFLITLFLIDNPRAGQTRWDSLSRITSIFKEVADNEQPEIYTLSHPMIDAWGARELLFTKLESSEYRKRQIIIVTLEFTEHDSAAGVIQSRQSTANAAVADASSPPVMPVVSDGQRRGLGVMEARYANL